VWIVVHEMGEATGELQVLAPTPSPRGERPSAPSEPPESIPPTTSRGQLLRWHTQISICIQWKGDPQGASTVRHGCHLQFSSHESISRYSTRAAREEIARVRVACAIPPRREVNHGPG